jgi:hypothetical protein
VSRAGFEREGQSWLQQSMSEYMTYGARQEGDIKDPGVQSAQCPHPLIETVDLSVLGVLSDDHSIVVEFHDEQKCQ